MTRCRSQLILAIGCVQCYREDLLKTKEESWEFSLHFGGVYGTKEIEGSFKLRKSAVRLAYLIIDDVHLIETAGLL
jgi:hypothetical protein